MSVPGVCQDILKLRARPTFPLVDTYINFVFNTLAKELFIE